MDWLDHALRESPILCGAIAGVVTFVLLRFARPQQVRTATSLVAIGGFGMIALFKVMRFWPPTFVQSEILAATILGGFLLGLMLSRLGSLTFDAAVWEFVIGRSILKSALIALLAGVFVALLPLIPDNSFSEGAFWAAMSAWATGSTFGHWRRMVRAGGA